MFPRVVLTTLFVLASVTVTVANEPAAPGIDDNTLIGTWEGTGGALWYWYRMEIFHGGGYLAYLTSPGKQDQALYRLEYSNISKGKVRLRFRNVTKNSTLPEAIAIEGNGWAFSGGGKLYATVTNHIANLRDKSCVDFVKGTPTRFIAKMFKDAEHMIDDAKRNRR